MQSTKTTDIEVPFDLQTAEVASSATASLISMLKTAIYEWKKRTVLVLGFTGSGKTSLLRDLFGATVPPDETNSSTLDVNKYIFRVGNTQFVCADTPGHPTVRGRLDTEIDSLVRGDYQGVINVVCYGFNQSRHRGAEHNPYKPVLKSGRVNPRYLKQERREELEYLTGWAKLVDPTSGLEWVMTVANKADLWFKKSAEVRDYYVDSGKYAELLDQNLDNFRHEYVKLCAAIEGFHGKKVQTKNIPSNDQRKEMRDTLLKTLHQLLSK